MMYDRIEIDVSPHDGSIVYAFRLLDRKVDFYAAPTLEDIEELVHRFTTEMTPLNVSDVRTCWYGHGAPLANLTWCRTHQFWVCAECWPYHMKNEYQFLAESARNHSTERSRCNECGREGRSVDLGQPCDTVYLDSCCGVFERDLVDPDVVTVTSIEPVDK